MPAGIFADMKRKHLPAEYKCITMDKKYIARKKRERSRSRKESIRMDAPKLQIRPKKYTGESTVTSVRLPKDMIRDIDLIANQTGRTRNEILMMFVLK